ncbi:MAG: hypothetical protein MR874_10875 [Coriobacteriaceae bacterium]|nr:hypothetical protein [Coriobacteriaceae bacterium]MDD7583703.1 hypothetical protein [Coriobacteriaceae bacterium]
MTAKIKKAIVTAGLALVTAAGFVAPALAGGGSFNACLPAWQMPATVRNGYHNGGSSAVIQVYKRSHYGGNFWIELPGQGQCADSVTVNPGKISYPEYYSAFSGSVTLMGHQVGWGPNACDRVSGYVNFN